MDVAKRTWALGWKGFGSSVEASSVFHNVSLNPYVSRVVAKIILRKFYYFGGKAQHSEAGRLCFVEIIKKNIWQ